jgi:hypothetical protein
MDGSGHVAAKAGLCPLDIMTTSGLHSAADALPGGIPPSPVSVQ